MKIALSSTEQTHVAYLGVHQPRARKLRQARQVDVAFLPRVVARDVA